nr:ABC transporter ATP-binding protein [Clostridium fallax]
MSVEKPRDFKGTMKRILKYLSPKKVQLFIIFIMAILSTLFSIVSPTIMGKATTKLFEGIMIRMKIPTATIDYKYIGKLLIILAGFYVFSAIFSYFQQYIMAGVAQSTVLKMRKDVDEKLSKLPLKYYDSKTVGEILSRVTNDIDNVSSTLQQSITQLVTAVVTLVGVIIMMLTISPLLTLVTIITIPLCIIATKTIIKKSQQYFVKQQKVLGDLNGHVEEMYTGHKIVKAFGHEETSIEEFKEINNNLYEAGWKAQFISGVVMPIMTFINNIGYVIVCVVGGVMVTKRTLQIGDIQAFIQYSRQFTQPINQTASIANILQSTVASAERVFELLDELEEIPDKKEAVSVIKEENGIMFKLYEDKNDLLKVNGDVDFHNVNFGYKEDSILISDMNISAKKGQTIAIVGPTGAGKTTIINLLMRFYEINSGSIKIEGIDTRDIKRGDLRSLFGMVLQDTWLFNGTIKDNIAYGKENATEEEVISAAKAAHADHFIRTLPKGYDTVLNEEASNISQGQRQLLTIARAIIANPSILILDEATSSVDTRTELYIQKAMNKMMEGKTSFVIAHRLSTIKNADLILVMNHGHIIEKGTHEELLNKGGFYSDLYNSQFVNNIDEAV